MARPSTAAVRLTTGEREPVRLATTANITLSGLVPVDGVTPDAGDRVLVKDHADTTKIGIYDASEGEWYRSPDSRSTRNLQKGTTVFVREGTVNAGKSFRFNTTDPNIGEDAISVIAADFDFQAALDLLEQLQALMATFTPFDTVQLAIGSAVQSIDTGNADLDIEQTWLYIDGVYQFRNTYTVTAGVIEPVTPWPGDGVTINAEVRYVPAFSATLPNGSVTRSKLSAGFRKSILLTPQERGAVGDGTTDDTVALVAWAAACQADNYQPYIPEGIYLCTSQLDFSGGGAILGAGENKAIIRFTNAASGGFKCYPDSGGDPNGCFSIERLGIQTTAVIAKAIDIILPNDGDFTNYYRIGLRNIDIQGVPGSGGYFQTGVFERNVAYSERRKVRYWGSFENATAESGYYAGVAFDLDTQVVSDDPALGLSLENVYSGCTANFCHTGLRVRGFAEGIHVRDSNFAFVRRGIDAVAQTATRQPLLSVIGNHINAAEWCILADRFNQSNFSLNHLTRPGDNFAFTWFGIDLDDSLLAVINGNHILPEIVHPSAGETVAIRLSGDSWLATIGNNQIAGAISGSYKALAAAYRIQTGVQATRISGDNQYSGTITEILDDNSGQTDNIFTGVTVQSDGVTVGPVGGITLINFGPEFDVSASGGSVTINLAP
jgi:hypothetical protein